MTLSMNVTYVKAFAEKNEYCLIEANVLQKTKTLIFMRADIKTNLRDDQISKVRI
jgi:acyl-coenzyme A thioesterase PaaI-like protein